MRIYIVFCFISLQSDLQRRWKKEPWAAINDPEKKASGVGTDLGGALSQFANFITVDIGYPDNLGDPGVRFQFASGPSLASADLIPLNWYDLFSELPPVKKRARPATPCFAQIINLECEENHS